jgi:hypothetical protein
MGPAEFIALLAAPARETVEHYYQFLVDWRETAGTKIINELRKAPVVLGTAGQLLTPSDDTIFFPRERGDITIPDDLPVPIAHLPEVEDARNLLRDLGVRSFEWRELIREYLIKILSNPEAEHPARAGAMAGLRAYHQVRLQGSEDFEPLLGGVLLPARTADGSIRKLRPSAEIYFSSPWTGSNDLEVIYGPFGDAEFLDITPPRDSESRQDDFDFYRMLGVIEYPRLSKAETNTFTNNSVRHPHRGPLFQEQLRCALTDTPSPSSCVSHSAWTATLSSQRVAILSAS